METGSTDGGNYSLLHPESKGLRLCGMRIDEPLSALFNHIEVENDQETDNIWDAPQNQRSESPLPLQF